MALAACLLGYGEVGLWLKRESKRPNTWVKMDASNPYLKWIEDYSGAEYQQAVRTGIGTSLPHLIHEFSSSLRLLPILYLVILRCNGIIHTTICIRKNRSNGSQRPAFAEEIPGVGRSLGEVYEVGEGLLGYGYEPLINLGKNLTFRPHGEVPSSVAACHRIECIRIPMMLRTRHAGGSLLSSALTIL